MVLEHAEFDILPGLEAAFEQGVAQAIPLFRAADGCRSLSLCRVIESPQRYRLVVAWDTVEAHTDDFRGSQAFSRWRELVGSCFAAPPRVDHVREVLTGFGPAISA